MNELFSTGFGNTLLRFAVCLIVNWFIVHFLYFRKSNRRDFYFTFVIISIAIFFLVYFMMGMERGKATMGVGLGLFGIFSIMRYRTDAMPVREMTYLFVVVCLSVVHAMADSIGIYTTENVSSQALHELIVIDAVVIATIIVFESFLKVKTSKLIQYDRLELVKKSLRKELIADLEERLELKVVSVKVGAIDFLHDMAMLRVYYEEGDGDREIDNKLKIKSDDYANV